MSQAARSRSPLIVELDAAAAVRRELRTWAWLAVGALAVAGVFALLLALSRIPGMDKASLWPLGFFYKGLVIHVVFSLVIWFLAVFAFLMTIATLRVGAEDLRAAPLGRIGQGFVLIAFPFLFAPAFLDATQPELTNYIPLIRHPAYDLGLLLLAVGVLAPVLRLFLNLPGRRAAIPPLALAMSVAGFIYCLALIAFAIAGALLAERGELSSREPLFWGGGHLLQFVYAVVLVTNWRILAAGSFGAAKAAVMASDPRVEEPGGKQSASDDRLFRIAVLLIGALAIPAPFFYAIFSPFSVAQHEAFRFLQFGIAVPTLIFAVSLVAKARALGRPSDWPWRDPAFFTLATSLALFALGGVMGFLINGSDTRTPAHYHAVITAVSVSSAGMLLTFGLEELGLEPASAAATRWLIALYGGGQFVASIGMFVAGGYGAARKTPDGVGTLDAVAAAGMAVHGIASIFTIIGGAAFVVVAIRALMRQAPVRAAVLGRG
jgi:cytochrome c oxidase subunit I